MNRDQKPETAKTRVFSGIKPSGQLTIGHYFGALRQWIDLQKAYEQQCYFCIVDLHATTVPYQPDDLRQNTFEIAVDYLALGLDPAKAVLFVQSHLPEHAELMWLLNTLTPVAELERMTQYKDFKLKYSQHVNAGLLNYPVLMAADILLYKATVVPVGEDQQQHVELARTIARKFNAQFGRTFPEPQARLMPEGARLKSLTNPLIKMSKTDDAASYIGLDEPPEAIKKKISKAVTATQGGAKVSPGVQNLFTILRAVSDPKIVRQFETVQKDGSIRYVDLKEKLAKDLADYFSPFRQKKVEILKQPQEVSRILKIGADRARLVARATLKEVKQKMGLG